MSEHDLIDEADLPVNQTYLNRLNSVGIKPVVISRWLNGVSARMNKEQLRMVQKELYTVGTGYAFYVQIVGLLA